MTLQGLPFGKSYLPITVLNLWEPLHQHISSEDVLQCSFGSNHCNFSLPFTYSYCTWHKTNWYFPISLIPSHQRISMHCLIPHTVCAEHLLVKSQREQLQKILLVAVRPPLHFLSSQRTAFRVWFWNTKPITIKQRGSARERFIFASSLSHLPTSFHTLLPTPPGSELHRYLYLQTRGYLWKPTSLCKF